MHYIIRCSPFVVLNDDKRTIHTLFFFAGTLHVFVRHDLALWMGWVVLRLRAT
jgi:hypothetical protein